ncbi:MAG: LamG-like jellyroll fold domain-containing protein [Crocinitomicaceae bacterium]|nr:T9SS type A sorting domain-containing protein [Crocinitomicaceae bacterium]
MKNLIVGIFVFFSFVSFGQDTINVQTFTYDTISTRRAIFSFPAELQGKTFEKVLMYYNIKCDPLTPWDGYNCGEWDYLAYAKIFDHTGILDSVIVEGPQYLVNNQWLNNVEYVNTPYYHYYQQYQKFITYSAQTDNDHAIGTGTDNATYPFGASNFNQRTQLLWTAAELSTAGVTAGEIAKLRFDVNTLGGALGNLTIKLKHTSATDLSSFDDTGWTTVFEMNSGFGSTGLNTINLTYPFNYDGTSNILMDISFENGSYTIDNEVNSSITSNNSVVTTNEKLGYLNIPQNDFVEIALTDHDFQDEITISFWSNGDGGILPVNTSVIEAGDSLNNRILNIHFPWSDGQFYWDAGEGSGYDRINQAATSNEYANEWHHWAFTKNKNTGEMNIYKDGTLWLNGTGKDRAIGIVNSFKIGANRNEGNGWPGKIDEFRVWDVELSQTEIANWMNQKITPSHPNYADLVLYYDFDGQNAVVDKSGNNVDGMMTTPGMIEFYEGSQAGYSVSNVRPNIVFVQGTYTSSLDSTMVTDSVMVDPIDITEFQVSSRKFTIANIEHKYPVGYSYTYDHLGVKLDSTMHAADVTFANDSIFYYEEPFEIIDPFEIGRFITPYGIGFDLGANGFTYIYDVTDYQQLLQGDVDLQCHNTQELIDIQFKFIVGTPPRDLISVEKLWNGLASYTYANLDNDVNLPSIDVPLDANGDMFKIRTRITGHGHNGTVNCCEWGNGQGRDHELLINGSSAYVWEIWQDTECGDNPNIGQGGTWPYAREGWCPGDKVTDYEFDITPFVTAGTTAAIDYDIEDVPSNDLAQGNGNYVIAMHLITYGAPNFTNDVAMVDILNPNEWEYYSKWNPTCQNPRVLIKNTGSATLTSCRIHISVGQYDNVVVYDWTGSLEFLEEELVEIPITQGFWNDYQGSTTFTASVELPNGLTDEYTNNNSRSVNFEPTDAYFNDVIIWYKANNHANENIIYLINDAGDTIHTISGTANGATVKDTLTLDEGCYTLEIWDTDHDGIAFWYAQQYEGEGSGYLKLKEVGGTTFTFDPDFGRYAKYNFSIGYSLGTNDFIQNHSLEVYPNPGNGLFNLIIDNFKGDQLQLEVYNELGAMVYNETVTNELYFEGQIDLSKLSKGIYTLRVVSEDQMETKRIVIH